MAAIVFDHNADIVCMNHMAEKHFEHLQFKPAKIHALFAEKRQFDTMMALHNEHKTLVRKKSLLKNAKNVSVLYETSLQIIHQQTDYWMLCFEPMSENRQFLEELLAQKIKKEIQTLRPYLNKAGKELLDKIIESNVQTKNFGIVDNVRNQLIQTNKISLLLAKYPTLTPNEIDLCVYLSMRLNYKQIALINKKTEIATRVSVHRLLRKLKIATLNDLLISILQLTE